MRIESAVVTRFAFGVCYLFLMTATIVAQEVPPVAATGSADEITREIRHELAQVKQAIRQIDERIVRLELLIDLEQAVRLRDETMDRWRALNADRENIESFGQQEALLRGKYFKLRTDIELIQAKLNQ